MMEIIITQLIKLGPIVTVLVLGLVYFFKKEKSSKLEIEKERDDYRERIDELNKEIRKTEKQNIELLSKLGSAIEKLYSNTNEISKEVTDFKFLLIEKLSEINKKK